jgi:hypothetical protein
LWHEDGWEVFCLVFWICCTFGTFDTKHQTCITSMHGTNMIGWWFQPLWQIWKSVGIIVPNIWKYKTCSKPTTRWVGVYHVHLSHQWLTMLYPFGRSARLVLCTIWTIPSEHICAIMGVGWGCLWHDISGSSRGIISNIFSGFRFVTGVPQIIQAVSL